MITGWASGRFGFFGLMNAEVPANQAFNYVGVAIAMLSIIQFMFITPTHEKTNHTMGDTEEYQPFFPDDGGANFVKQRIESSEQARHHFLDHVSPASKKIIGCVMAVISGLFYGINFNPPQILIDTYCTVPATNSSKLCENAANSTECCGDHSPNSIDYAFSHFTGIYLCSTLFMIIYAALMKNKPVVYPYAILPSLLSGFMWATAQLSWFVANANLSMSIAFPIIATGPGVVAALWGILLFGEIRGRKNFILFGSATLCLGAAGIFIALSKKSGVDTFECPSHDICVDHHVEKYHPSK